ncbi:MAG: hypothetical protein ACTSVZ_04690 [Promethearchaeota archaeon]
MSNSSPLILLAKVDQLELLFTIFDKIFIPSEVFQEVVVKGKKKGQLDAFLVEEKVNEGKIEIKEIDITKIKFPHLKNNYLHPGELDAINLALSLSEDVILLDDEEARVFARALGLQVKGTLGLLIDFKKFELIDEKEAQDILQRLNSLMYLSGDLYYFVQNQLKLN